MNPHSLVRNNRWNTKRSLGKKVMKKSVIRAPPPLQKHHVLWRLSPPLKTLLAPSPLYMIIDKFNSTPLTNKEVGRV